MLYGYLFYSNYDDKGFCKSLITLLERHGLNKIFEYKLVDNMSDEQLMKLQLNEIPALLVISDNGNGQKQQFIYEAKNAFQWVDNFLIGRRQAMMKNAESSRKLIQNSNTKEKLTQKLYEYCPSEHSGISDGYAYYHEDENKDRLFTVPQGKMFSNGLGFQNDNIGAIPLPGSGKLKDYKAKEGLTAVYGNEHNIKKAIENMQRDRVKQDEALGQNMQEDIVKIVVGKIGPN
jgi:hypothetical protein